MRRLFIVAAMALALPAAAQLNVTVSDSGQVNVDIGGVRCVDSFQVILPGPDWKGGAGPTGCTRETVGPGHIRVTGTMTDAKPCATFSLDSQATDEAVDLCWELRFTRDVDVETVRLNSYLPCSVAAGKGAWFTHRPDGMKWSLLPASYGDPGGSMGDWGFDWFGYILPGNRGLRFVPRGGINAMYLQDGRQWGSEMFQTCWTLADKGTLRSGTVLRASIRLELLRVSDLVADAKRAGVSLLAATGTLRPVAGGGGVEAQVQVRNVQPTSRQLDISYTVSDDLGAVLAEGKRRVEAPPLGAVSVAVPVKSTVGGDYRLRARVRAADGASESCDGRLAVPGTATRSRTSLDGDWQLCAADAQETAPPSEAKWQATPVPGTIADSPNRHWYRRAFDLPPGVAGKRLKLHFEAVNHDARVFVNGRAAGQHFGGNLPFDCDITDLVRPGSNELTVLVTNWTVACTNPPEQFVVAKFEHPGWKIPPGTIIAPIGGDFRRTGIWQSVYLDTCDLVHVTNAFVQTSVRKHEIRVTATVRNDGATSRTVTVQNDIASRAGAALRLPAQTVTLAPGEEHPLTVTAAWTNAHLWSLDDPYLYRLATRVTDEGRTLDVLATRFGFREVWTDGPRFLLNGTPMKLFATSGWSMETWQAAYAHLSRMKKAGTRAMRLHTQPWQEFILSAADEVGLLIVDEAAVYCYAQSYAPKDARFWENYATHVRALAMRDRNHPSLAIYSLENEIISCGGEPSVWEPQLGRLAGIVREVDPTRLITCESDLDPAGKMDLIGMHYPREYWAGFTLYPDKSWWMDQEIPYLGRQWKWKHDKPLYIGEFDGGFPAWYPQYQAFWLGDEAYTSRGNFSVSSPNSRARREMIEQEVQAYRYYGVTGLNPWFDSDEVDGFGPKAYAPFAVAVREWTHHFWSGEAVERTVCILNDSADRAKLRLSWDVAGPGVREQSGSLDVESGPSTSQMRTISFRAPMVTRRTDVRLRLALRCGSGTLATTEQAIGIYPPQAAPSGSRTPGLYLYDPKGTAAGALQRVGTSAAPLADLAKLPGDCRVLVIAPGALKGGSAPWAPQLAGFVASGGSVICLAQEAYPDRWLPVDVTVDARHSTTIAFPRVRTHPALAGVTDGDLRFWRPDHVVATRSLLKPTRGNFTPLIDAGGICGSIDDRNGLNWTPLLEMPYGRGRYLLCQLPLAERVASEPVAGTLLRQLIAYAESPGSPQTATVGLLAPPGSPLKETLDGLGVEYESLLGSPGPDRLGRCSVAIAGGGPEAWEWLRSNLDAVRTWLGRGGALWLKNLTPEQADLLSQLAGGKCEFRSADVTNICLAAPDAITAGLSNHELYWRDRPIWDQWTALRRSMDFEPTTLPASARRLTDPPALVKIPVGKGCLLLDQILWDSTTTNRLDGQRIASILLTNLGVRFDIGRFKAVREADFQPLDISRLCNLGFAGDPGAGWMGHPPDTLAQFPLGKQTLAGAVFRIIDPADNGGKSVIALRGTARASYPPAATGITVGMRARALHFLHVCAWGSKDGTEVGAYVVHYADGTSVRIPLRVGAQLADWYVDPVELPFAQVAWTGNAKDKPGPIGMYAMRWLNAYPDREIASLDFVSAGGDPVPVLVAVSAER